MILKEQKSKLVYSDGTETEAKLLDIARKYPEDSSEDYIADNSQYLVNNTFSSVRKNLLNWYPFKEGSDILEIGAGAGALTGFLCDKAKSVVSIEMSEARANIIRTRYPDRKNLTVISESIQNWKTEKKFDYIVFVGVLEYAAVFSDAVNPFVEFLSSVNSHLKQDGILLFAIENRFGLKYWLGASEDHLQKPFIGIDGYKEKKTAQTFSKETLKKICFDSGLKNTRFYSVYPDYKFPEIICADGYTLSAENLRKINFTYSKNSILYADERDLYREIIENNVSTFFANSFLVEASQSLLSDVYPVFVAGKSEVKKEYRVCTVIYSDGKVMKIPVHKLATQHIQNIMSNTLALKKRGLHLIDIQENEGKLYSSFYKGKSAQDYFISLLEKNDFESICLFLANYKQELQKSSEPSEDGNILYELEGVYKNVDFGLILKNGYIDLTFYNAFYENGSFIFYDQEWRFDNVPMLFILYYAIKSSYTRANVATRIPLKSLYDFLNITEVQQTVFEKLENYIWQKILYRTGDIYGEDGYCNRYTDNLTMEFNYKKLSSEVANKDAHIKQLIESGRKLNGDVANKDAHIKQLIESERKLNGDVANKTAHIEQLLESERRLNAQIHDLDSEIRKRDSEIRALKNSLSWRVTKPLRFAKKVVRKVYHILVPHKLRTAIWIFRHRGMKGIKEHIEKKKYGQVLPEPITYRPSIIECVSYEKHVLPECDRPLASIVIPVYNQFDYTYKCILSILNTVRDISYEIIIADDMSTDETAKITEYFPNIRVNKNESDHGFLMNCNRAAKLAKGEFIVFLNNDTQVQENWLSSLVKLIQSDENIGMVGSKLVYPNGTLQEAGGIIWNDASGWNYGRGKDPELPEYNYVKEVDYISGASIMIRSSLWKEIGGFDERYKPAYYEDSDLAFEVRKHGFKVMYQPESVAVHFEGVSNGTDLTSGLKKYQVENHGKFVAKWENELKKQYSNGENVFFARERNYGKKVILIIDHYVPTFDKDAGSKTTFQYIKMFLEKGYAVKFVGDNYAYKEMEPYMSTLLQMGVEVLYGVWYLKNFFTWLKNNEKSIDFVYLNRPHITRKYIDFIREQTGIKIIYYGHDLHFFREQREYELTGNEELKEHIEKIKHDEFDIMHKADVVYYPSYLEEKAIKDVDPSINVKAINAYIFDSSKINVDYSAEKRNGILFVGGFSHTPNIDAVKWFAGEIFPKIHEKNPDINFYIAGANAPEEIKKLDGNGIVFKGFVTEEELSALYKNCRIVVVPLRYGAGVKGKVIEALYNGCPIVTTDIGAEGIREIENIVEIHNEPDNFAYSIIRLYSAPEKLKEMSKKSTDFIKENFSINSAWNVIKEDF